MKAEIKHIHCSDVEQWADHLPADPKDFVLPFQLMIGTIGQNNTSNFQILVCGETWFEREIVAKRKEFPVHHMVIKEYDSGLIEDALKTKVASCEGENWEKLASQLSQFFHWEFEMNQD